MDSLSALMDAIGLRGRVDLLCHFAGQWSAEHPQQAAGQVPYHVVLEGRGVLEVGHARRSLEAGDLVMFPHGTAHILRHADGATLVYPKTEHPLGLLTEVASAAPSEFDVLCGTFELAHHRTLLLQALPDVVHLATRERPDYAALHSLMHMMRRESVQAWPGGETLIGQLSSALFTLVVRTLMTEGQLREGLLGLLLDARLAPALAAVIAAPAEPWTLARMAEVARMSRASFARHFAQLSAMTPLDVVTALRMDRAARLLRESPQPVERIGEACGYTSRAAFGQAFRRVHGMSPLAYRKQREGAAAAAVR